MIKRFKKKTVFILSLGLVGGIGLVHNIIIDNFTKSQSTFRKESISELPQFVQTAEADVYVPPVFQFGGGDGDGDGSGDGSNGI